MTVKIFSSVTGHLYTLFGEIPIQTFCSFLNWVVCFSSFLIYLKIFLKYSCFTTFYKLLLYSKVTQSYIHTCTFFLSYYLPSCSITRDWIEFPVLYSRTSLLIHYKCFRSIHWRLRSLKQKWKQFFSDKVCPDTSTLYDNTLNSP